MGKLQGMMRLDAFCWCGMLQLERGQAAQGVGGGARATEAADGRLGGSLAIQEHLLSGRVLA